MLLTCLYDSVCSWFFRAYSFSFVRLGRVSDISNVLYLEMLFRRRVHRRLVSDEIRHTPCVVDVGPRLTICKNRPVGNVVTLLSVRESVSSKLLTGFSLKKGVSFPSAV